MVTKKTASVKKPVATKKATIRKRTVSSKAKSIPKAQKVDIYPNRMTVAVSALAGTVLLLVTIIAVLGSRS